MCVCECDQHVDVVVCVAIRLSNVNVLVGEWVPFGRYGHQKSRLIVCESVQEGERERQRERQTDGQTDRDRDRDRDRQTDRDKDSRRVGVIQQVCRSKEPFDCV